MNCFMEKEIIGCNQTAKAIGAYSQLVKIGNMLYSSGQIALDPSSGKLVGDDIDAQTNRVMKSIGLMLAQAGSDFSKLIKVTVYLRNMNDFVKFNERYQSYFGKKYPARSTVELSNLPKQALLEIDFIAYCS